MANIVLAHGFLGFGENFLPVDLNYFNGVADMLRGLGHKVLVPMVTPLGSLDARSTQLAAAIASTDEWPGDAELAVIAHSMGGLDARRVLNRHEAVGSRIRTLITIATPHLGTPVADAMVDTFHPLRALIPPWMEAWLRRNNGALEDLQTRTLPQDPDRPGVRYMEVACVAPPSFGWSGSLLFRTSREIGRLYGPNDGVVTFDSACCRPRKPIEEWPLDHGEAIGWPSAKLGFSTLFSAFSPPAAHLKRYASLAARL